MESNRRASRRRDVHTAIDAENASSQSGLLASSFSSHAVTTSSNGMPMRSIKSYLLVLTTALLFSSLCPSIGIAAEIALSEGDFVYVRRYLNQRPLPGASPTESVSFRCSGDGAIIIKIDSKEYGAKRGDRNAESLWIVSMRVVASLKKSFPRWLTSKKERSENRVYVEMTGSGLDMTPHVEERILFKKDGTEYELRLLNYLGPGLPNLNTDDDEGDYPLLYGMLSSIDAIASVFSRDIHAVRYPARQGLPDQLEMLLPVK